MRRFLATLFFTCILLVPFLILAHAWEWLLLAWATGCFVFLYPTLTPNCSLFGSVINRFKTDHREIWLTFDDGPHPLNTPKILDLLEKHRAKATFFVIGKHASRYPGLIQEILAQGHTLGNHSQTHPVATFWMAGPARIAREIDACRLSLSAIQKSAVTAFFRAPVGMANFFVQPLLRKRGLQLIGWSARGFDAVHRNPEKIVERIWRDISPGAIVLLHEAHHGRKCSQELNPEVVALLLNRLALAGYSCILPAGEQFIGLAKYKAGTTTLNTIPDGEKSYPSVGSFF